MKVQRLNVGQLATNCYLVWDEKTQETLIIDPGEAADYIEAQIADLKLKPTALLATHAHFDHVLAVLELKLAYQIPFLIHKKDVFLLKQAQKSAKYFLGIDVDPVASADRFLKEKEMIKFGQEVLKVIETPGHTPGGISLLGKGVIFSGDTLFADGLGRTDFSYSLKKDLDQSLSKIFKLPEETILYPGHGEISTIGEAKRSQICYNETKLI